MFTFPPTMPEIEITRLDDAPFPVECREMGWMTVPEVGSQRHFARYEYPSQALETIHRSEGIRNGVVHDRETCEMRFREYHPDGTFKMESLGYGLIHEGIGRWDGWWNIGEPLFIYTYKDDDFKYDWWSSPVRIEDTGRFRWIDDTHVEVSPVSNPDPLIDPIGAGVCRVRLNSREHNCLRALDVEETRLKAGVLNESFINADGRTVLSRRYNGPEFFVYDTIYPPMLVDSPKLTVNGTPFSLWGVNVPEDALTQ